MVSGMMEQHHIDIFNIQLVKRFVNGFLRVGKLVGVELGDDKDFFRLVISLIENGGNLHRLKRQLDHVLVGFRAARHLFPGVHIR